MRRVILWIVAISITFAIGTGFDSLLRYLSVKESPAVAQLEAAPFKIDVPEVEKTPPVPEPAPAPNLILDYDHEKFTPMGTLHIIGPAPKGFGDFDFIELDVPVGDDVDYHGYIAVYSRSNQEHFETAPANFALVTERTLYFTTSPSENSGFEYRFEGQFLLKNLDSVGNTNKAAVRGILTKSKDGRTIAEHTITFRLEFDGC